MGILFVIGAVISSCSSEEKLTSENEFYEYFYPYDTLTKVYVYRDVKSGIDEQFHCVYGIEDSQGKHIVVETFSEDGRILEAINYSIDSLNVMDHMVVDAQKIKNAASIGEAQLMPLDRTTQGVFSSVFPVTDSTLFLKEVKRMYDRELSIAVMGEKADAVCFREELILTLMNPFTKEQGARGINTLNYYAKGYGLVEWFDDPEKQSHWKLEKIISREEFTKILSR